MAQEGHCLPIRYQWVSGWQVASPAETQTVRVVSRYYEYNMNLSQNDLF